MRSQLERLLALQMELVMLARKDMNIGKRAGCQTNHPQSSGRSVGLFPFLRHPYRSDDTVE